MCSLYSSVCCWADVLPPVTDGYLHDGSPVLNTCKSSSAITQKCYVPGGEYFCLIKPSDTLNSTIKMPHGFYAAPSYAYVNPTV